ncbi:hypothetical protein ScPMuIL_017774 [Solemya velum]
MEKISFPGKVAVVTGGARGIGKAYVQRLLEKGAKVVILDILKDEGEASLEELQGKFGRDNVYFYYCDVTNGKLFEDVLKSINKDIGKLDIMVNNAGAHNEDDWEQTIHINLDFNLSRHYKHTVQANTALSDSLRQWHGTMEQLNSEDADWGIRYHCMCAVGVDTALVHKVKQITGQKYFDHAVEKTGGLLSVEEITDEFMKMILHSDNGCLAVVKRTGVQYMDGRENQLK